MRINNNWKDKIYQTIGSEFLNYPTPSNLNYAYSFGSIIGFYFVLQIFTGILLAMHYIPHADFAFDSIVNIMQNVNNGWLIRYMHMNGASVIFIFLYLHIGKGIYYKSYLDKRAILWWSGVIILLLMMGTAFIGYVLPWGQMSYWGATVITNLVTVIPFVGPKIVYWVWGGYSVSGATLTRFYSLHYLLPLIIAAMAFAHLVLLHKVGSTNPSQTETKNGDYIRFHPYYTVKDLFAINVSLIFFVILVFFYPNWLGHPDNYIKANSLVTPAHIVPEWYFTPFYAILRSCSSKVGGVINMLMSILILVFLPLSSRFTVAQQLSPVLSGLHKVNFWIFVATFLLLMRFGGKPAIEPFIFLSRIYTVVYFGYFIILISNLFGRLESIMKAVFDSERLKLKN